MNYFYLKDLAGGGVQKMHVKIFNQVVEAGKKCEIVVSSLNKAVLVPHVRGGLVTEIKGLGLRRVIAFLKRLKADEKPLIVVGNGREAVIVGLMRLLYIRHAKIIYVQHVDIFLPQAGWLRNRLRAAVFGMIGRYADRLVFVSNTLRESLTRRYSYLDSKSLVIYNPVLDLCEESSELALEKRLPSSKIKLLNIGRLCFQKNQGFLLDVLRKLQDRKGNFFELHLVGEGEDRRALEDKAAALRLRDSVFFHGWLDQPFELMQSCDVFCLSSRWEGLPTVLIEALQYAPRIVAVDCPHGVMEIMCNSHCGTIVSKHDVADFVEAVLWELDNKPRDLAVRNIERFSSSSAGENYLKLLGEFE